MSKKQKRQVSSGAGSAAPVAEKISASRITASTEFHPDYAPVIKDLKRIGILAGSFIGLLVILSFFLR
ncbi:hypothetical protein LARV_01661 [Longilinea arvoryzae]|uniref:Uncharacterized protein n=1 Tax=Longilinea arvoryzae TaxID=360412 RepID=A0A0S7B9E8_9CHLR|nr:hypothetical protein [Longilinea arvoryzae]GAP13902.1 hypothetical protein LARV_01661 [Longilinea arvoryzae]